MGYGCYTSYFLVPPLLPDAFPLAPPVEVLGGLLPRPPPDGRPVVLGAFFNPFDFAIFL